MSDALQGCPVCQTDAAVPVQASATQMRHDRMSHLGPPPAAFQFSRCLECKTVYLEQRVSPALLEKYYDEDYLPYRGAAAFGSYAPLVSASFRAQDGRRIALVDRYHCRDLPIHLLDVGCGKPTFVAALLDRHREAKAIGLDFSDNGWRDDDSFAEYQKGDKPRLALQTGEPHQMQVASQSLTAITMWHYLEHDYDPLATLQALRERLHRLGVIIAEVPHFGSLSQKMFRSHWAGLHTPRHTILFDRTTLSSLFKRAGYEVIAWHPYGTMSAATLSWLSCMERFPSLALSSHRMFWSHATVSVLMSPLMPLQRVLPLGLQTIVARQIV